MRFVNQFFMSTGKLGLISGLEPETAAGLLLFDDIPSPFDQTNINEFIKRMKDAAGLSYGVNNLNTAYDFVYLMAVSSLENARVNYAKGIKEAVAGASGWGDFIPYQGFRSVGNGAFNTKFKYSNPGNLATFNNTHFTISNCQNHFETTTRNAGGFGVNFSIVLQGSVSLTPRWRATNGSSSFDNLDVVDNRKGAFFMQRTSSSSVNYRRNNSSAITASRTFSSIPDNELLICGYNNGSNIPQAPDTDATISHSTFGISGVNSLTINTAIRDYMLNYGITLF